MNFPYRHVLLYLSISIFCSSIYGCVEVGRNSSESLISGQIERTQQELNELTAENEALKQEINLLKIENQNQQTNTEILVSDNTLKN